MKKRFLFAALLLVAMLTTFCASALADADVPPPNQISKDLHFSAYEWHREVMPIASSELTFTRLVASITKSSSTTVSIRAVTEANKTCDLIGVIMFVQQWKNNQWNSYHSSSATNLDSDSVTGTKVVTVDSGYYYRLGVTHRAYYFNETKLESSYTNSILVN